MPEDNTLQWNGYGGFQCRMCGECCSGKMRVFLNPADLARLARYLKFNHTSHLFDKGVVMIEAGQNSAPLPRIRFRTHPYPFCPFLENRQADSPSTTEGSGWLGLCTLHGQPGLPKPLICRLAPLCRSIDLENSQERYTMIPPYPDCPGILEKADPQAEITRKELTRELQDLRPELEKEALFFTELQYLLDRNTDHEEIVQSLFYFSV